MELIEIEDSKMVTKVASFVVKNLEAQAQLTDKPLVLGLSGGGSPKTLYPVIADLMSTTIAKRLILIQIDERIVAPTHEDSNQKLIIDTLGALIDDGAKFYPMPVHSTEASACKEYEDLLQDLFYKSADPFMAFLGAGPDGHTASIFPDQLAFLPQDNRLVFMTPQEKNGYVRMSLSFKALFDMHNAIFYIPGAAKREIVKELLNTNNIKKYPAAKVLHNHSNSYLFATKQ